MQELLEISLNEYLRETQYDFLKKFLKEYSKESLKIVLDDSMKDTQCSSIVDIR